jgi:hypothetical protein
MVSLIPFILESFLVGCMLTMLDSGSGKRKREKSWADEADEKLLLGSSS